MCNNLLVTSLSQWPPLNGGRLVFSMRLEMALNSLEEQTWKLDEMKWNRPPGRPLAREYRACCQATEDVGKVICVWSETGTPLMRVDHHAEQEGQTTWQRLFLPELSVCKAACPSAYLHECINCVKWRREYTTYTQKNRLAVMETKYYFKKLIKVR